MESSRKFGRATLRYLGSLEDRRLLVVVGRHNVKKRSAALDRLLGDVHAAGMSVCWFETPSTQTFKLLDQRFESLLGPRALRFFAQGTVTARVVQKLAKTLILLSYPARWGYFASPFRDKDAQEAGGLRRFLHRIPADEVCLFAQSAGGIVSAMVEDEPTVRRLICVGYPFRHPERGEEAYRTRRLAHLLKPFLIIQGTSDPYGSVSSARGYDLSPAVRLASVEADHDYDSLTEPEYRDLLRLVQDFVGLPPRPA